MFILFYFFFYRNVCVYYNLDLSYDTMSVYKELKRKDAVRKIQDKTEKQELRVEFAPDIRSKSHQVRDEIETTR